MKDHIKRFAQDNDVSYAFAERVFFDDGSVLSLISGNGLTLDSGWKSAEPITFGSNGVLQMPADIPDKPGLYKLVFGGNELYVGEASNIRRRIGDYLIYYSATGIESEFRINTALKAAGGANVFYYVGEDVSSRSERCKIEARLVKEAKEAGRSTLNGGTTEAKIAFHASEIIRLTAKLQNSRSDD